MDLGSLRQDIPTRDELADAVVKAVDERGTFPISPNFPRATGYSREDYAEEFGSSANAIQEVDPNDNRWFSLG